MEDTRCSAPSDDGGKQFFKNLKDMNEEVVVVLFGIVSWLWFSTPPTRCQFDAN